MQTMKLRYALRCLSLAGALHAAGGCASAPAGGSGDDDDDEVSGSPAAGTGGSSSAPASVPERCTKCSSSADCATGFCNAVESNDLATLIGASQPKIGRCTLPEDDTTCSCQTGWISGGSVCIGTGCPPGEPVQLCDNLSGTEFIAGSSGTGGAGGAGGAGGSTSSSCSASTSSACEQCVAGSCCGELTICAGSSSCVALLDCLSPCTSDACVESCVNEYPTGATPLINLLSCIDGSCSVECG